MQSESSEDTDEADSSSTPFSLFSWQLAVLLVAQLCFGFAFSCFFLLPKYMTVELRSDAGTIGAVVAAASASGVLAVPLVGSWLDRWGRKPFITLGAVLTALSAFGFLLVRSDGPLIYVLRALQGFAFTLAFNAAATMVTDIAPRKRMGQAIGLFGLTLLSMNALAPAIAEPLAERAGWQSVFALSGGVATFGSLMTLLIRAPASTPGPRVSWSAALAPRLLLFYAVIAATGGAFGAVVTFYQPFALEQGITEVRNFFIGYTLLAIFVRVGLGSLGDRFGRRRVSIIALVLYASAVLAMTQLVPGRLFLLGAFLGFAHGIFYPTFNALTIETADDRVRGRVMTVFNGGFNGGFGLSVIGFGALAEVTGYRTVFTAAALMTFAAAAWLALAGTASPRIHGMPTGNHDRGG